MKRKYKLLLTRIIAVVLAFSLCGCGAAQTAASSAPAEEEPAETIAATAEPITEPEPEPAAEPVVEEPAEDSSLEPAVEAADESEPVDAETCSFQSYATGVDTFTAQNLPLYLDSAESDGDLPVSYLNGIYDIPYLSMDTVAELMTEIYTFDMDHTEDDAASEDDKEAASEDKDDSEDTSADQSGTGATASMVTAEKDTDATTAAPADETDSEATTAGDETADDETADDQTADADEAEDASGTDSGAGLISTKDGEAAASDEYSLTVEPLNEDGETGAFVFQRENGATMVVNFNDNTITFSDIDAFTAYPGAASPLDMVQSSVSDDNELFSHDSTFYKDPEPVTINLNDYAIFTIYQDDMGYLPLQTIADLLVSRVSYYLLYNGEAVIVASSITDPEEESLDEMLDDTSEDTDSTTANNGTTAAGMLTAAKDTDTTGTDETATDGTDATDNKETDASGTTEDDTDAEDAEEPDASGDGALISTRDDGTEKTVSDIYYSVEPTETSEELAIFTYNELCMALDYSYGLQDEHEISSFNTLFTQTGLFNDLENTSPDDTYKALQNLCNGYLADQHSGVKSRSCYSDADEVSTKYQDAVDSGDTVSNIPGSSTYNYLYYMNARRDYYPDDPEGYEEVGDTAYITFDVFLLDPDRDYYSTDITNTTEDTLELISYANEQIHRDGSPVKNVVIDLSNNIGGYVDAGVAVIAWMLGYAEISIEDTVSGAQSTCTYTFDANLDGTWDENDYLGSDYNLYCLISPNSFSCGNLVPIALKAAGNVTLLGKSTTGGACAVMRMSTADGNVFQLSSPYRLSTVSNGSYYSVDEGVDPDITISKVSHFYDREYLTDMIDDLP